MYDKDMTISSAAVEEKMSMGLSISSAGEETGLIKTELPSPNPMIVVKQEPEDQDIELACTSDAAHVVKQEPDDGTFGEAAYQDHSFTEVVQQTDFW